MLKLITVCFHNLAPREVLLTPEPYVVLLDFGQSHPIGSRANRLSLFGCPRGACVATGSRAFCHGKLGNSFNALW